jgi:hypothetical protein
MVSTRGLSVSLRSEVILRQPNPKPASVHDARWAKIERCEEECHRYLQESQAFLFNVGNQDPASTGHKQKDPVKPLINTLPKQPARFYGRTSELMDLTESLKKYQSVTLRGIAGVGKTSIALQFAYTALSSYHNIFWITCDPTTAIDDSCKEALRRLGVQDGGLPQVAEIRRRWRDHLAQTRLCT